MQLTPGQTLGNYKIQSLLGSGGMGEVYRATDERLQRDVALKVIRHGMLSEHTLQRFSAEARAASALNHPSIVTIYELGTTDELTYIAMELIAGSSLREVLQERKVLPVPEATAILKQLMSALATAHGRGIVHRDLKPENVMISADGARVKILDFGLAKRVDASAPDSNTPTVVLLTEPGTILGTPAYMSPEQARGDAADARSDQFSLGVIAHEMLNGVNPFRRNSALDSFAAITRDPAPALLRSVPSRIRQVVMRLLEKSPEKRFESLGEAERQLNKSNASHVRTLLAASAVVIAMLGYFFSLRRETPRQQAPLPRANQTTTTATATPISTGDAFIRARYLTEKHGEWDQRAIAAFEDVVRRDPRNARAWAALSTAYRARYFNVDANPEWEQKAFIAVEKALAIDENLADAYVARANLLWTPSRRFPHADALVDTQRALKLDPKLASAHGLTALILMHVGLPEEATRAVLAARRLQPTNEQWKTRSVFVAFYGGDFTQADEIIRLGNDSGSAAFALDALGRSTEAEQLLASAKEINSPVVVSAKALLAAKRNDRAQALQLVQTASGLETNLGHFHHAEHFIASTYSLLGDQTEALRWLERAARNGFPSRVMYNADPNLSALRADPRYAPFERKLKADADQMRKLLVATP